MNLNIRKQNCVVIYMSAQDWQIASTIRVDCKEVWMPVPKADFDVEVSVVPRGKRVRPENNPDNFRLAWHVWEDYPYKKANLIEGPGEAGERGQGFGDPAYTKYDEGGVVRRAFLLNDTSLIKWSIGPDYFSI